MHDLLGENAQSSALCLRHTVVPSFNVIEDVRRFCSGLRSWRRERGIKLSVFPGPGYADSIEEQACVSLAEVFLLGYLLILRFLCFSMASYLLGWKI